MIHKSMGDPEQNKARDTQLESTLQSVKQHEETL